jgi:hypothetical protein
MSASTSVSRDWIMRQRRRCARARGVPTCARRRYKRPEGLSRYPRAEKTRVRPEPKPGNRPLSTPERLYVGTFRGFPPTGTAPDAKNTIVSFFQFAISAAPSRCRPSSPRGIRSRKNFACRERTPKQDPKQNRYAQCHHRLRVIRFGNLVPTSSFLATAVTTYNSGTRKRASQATCVRILLSVAFKQHFTKRR